ncbi:MAG: cation diffusion facilitator family transporter [Desulfobacterales bacterium]|nr:cation diffusion facilitator family transporter [Desulfobacterales bacterium]
MDIQDSCSPTSKIAQKEIQRVTWIGLVGNVLLSMVKLFLGLAGNSQAVVADAIHSFSDTSSDIVILVGVKYWNAPADESHPFGHRKIESFVTIFIGLLLLGAAGGIAYSAILGIMDPVGTAPGFLVIFGPLLSILVKEFLFRITHRVGVKHNASSVKANAWHHRTDALSSIPVLLAVLGALISPKLAFLDPVGALLVSVFIVKVGGEILFSSINELLDAGMSRAEVDQLAGFIRSLPGVHGVHRIRTRRLAGAYSIDLHLEVDGELSVRQGHDISEQVRSEILEGNDHIIDVMVHLEPPLNSTATM